MAFHQEYKRNDIRKNAEKDKPEFSQSQQCGDSPCYYPITQSQGHPRFSGVQDNRESSDSDEGCEMYMNSSEMHNGNKVPSTNEAQQGGAEGPTMASFQCRNGNPWGGLSYADLITAAILSSKNKRMTLEEIYQWLVTNVSYFGDKRDDSSRVGWKNSIRCNLSTRKRFLHIPRASQTGVKTYRGWWTVMESMISTRKRKQLLMMFSEEARRPLPSSRAESPRTSANKLNMSSDDSPRTTNRETQTEMIRFCETCHYFMMLMAPHCQTVPPV